MVYAVHLEPSGATYKSTFDPFISAAPMPVTDLVVHPTEGCVYLTIGGRKVQSALYRVRYTGSESTEPAKYPDTEAAANARKLRHTLEAMHRDTTKFNLKQVLESTGSSDRSIRTAARIALEHQPVEVWKSSLSRPANAQTAITLAVALSRKGKEEDQHLIHRQLLELNWDSLNAEQRVELLRAYQLSFLRLGSGVPEGRLRISQALDQRFPDINNNSIVNRELARVLVYLEAPRMIEKCLERIKYTGAFDEQIHYAFCLREVKKGWNPKTRKAYFEWFYNVATARGGASFGGFVENIRQVAIKQLSDERKRNWAT